MRQDVINRSYKSKWIGGFYALATLFVFLIYVFIYLFAPYEASFPVTMFNFVMTLALFLMLITTLGFFTTKYVIKNGVLHSWSPFVVINLRLKDIKKVEKIMVPLHIRFGASLYSGFFYVPRLGWVRSIITNLKDAILITTKNGKYYMITPSNPKKFMKLLK